jgi:hydroxymethylpyrimidine/phosphomethylpyrimidine kinase
LTTPQQDDPTTPPSSLPTGASTSAKKPPVVLTIAGFDPSNGAGITADLQVFAAHGLFGTSAITALTIQSTISVAAVDLLWPANLRETLHHLTTDLPPAGIKIGMLGSSEMVREVVDFLQQPDDPELAKPIIPIVLDPVLRSSSGAPLLDAEGLQILRDQLLDQVTWITPNWQELTLLTETEVTTLDVAANALDLLHHRYPHLHVVATGGDQAAPIDLLLTPAGELHQFRGRRIETTSTHGTGCAFSSALLSSLVLGEAPIAAVNTAKLYVEGALQHAPGLGNGRGPLDLLWPLRRPIQHSEDPPPAPRPPRRRSLRVHM